MKSISAGANLRAQLKSGWVLSAGCFDAWSAKLAQYVGFSSLHFSGGSYHTSQFAYAGMVYTMPELAAQVARITEAVDIPILADIDTGFGGVEDILRTTRALERTGAGGVHIEDLPFPMRRAASGPAVISKSEAIGRVRAALAARQDPDFLIVGRTDSTTSIEDLIERSNLFLEAGADVAFPILRGVLVEGQPLSQLPTAKRLACYSRIVREVAGPIMTVCGVDRTLTAHQLRDVGFNWAILPLVALNAATGAMIAALREALDDGCANAYFDANPSLLTVEEYKQLLGYQQVSENERRFGGGG